MQYYSITVLQYYQCITAITALSSITAILVFPTFAATSEPTNSAVIGRAPLATNLNITGPAAPLVGDTLQGSYLFSDADLDAEQDSLLYWLDNSNSKLTNNHPSGDPSKFILENQHVGKQLRFAVTPATNPLLTQPHQGNEALSSPSAVVQGFPNQATSTFTADKSSIAANGTDAAVLALTLKDRDGTPVVGIRDRVAINYSGVQGITLTQQDRGGGLYEYTMAGTSNGIVTLTPQLDGKPLITTPPSLQVTLTPRIVDFAAGCRIGLVTAGSLTYTCPLTTTVAGANRIPYSAPYSENGFEYAIYTLALAKSYCTGLDGGYRLAGQNELRALYNTHGNMGTYAGWPTNKDYWSSSSPFTGSHYHVNLNNGSVNFNYDSTHNLVTCVR